MPSGVFCVPHLLLGPMQRAQKTTILPHEGAVNIAPSALRHSGPKAGHPGYRARNSPASFYGGNDEPRTPIALKAVRTLRAYIVLNFFGRRGRLIAHYKPP